MSNDPAARELPPMICGACRFECQDIETMTDHMQEEHPILETTPSEPKKHAFTCSCPNEVHATPSEQPQPPQCTCQIGTGGAQITEGCVIDNIEAHERAYPEQERSSETEQQKDYYTKDDKVCSHCKGSISGHLCGEHVIYWCDKCGSNNPQSPPEATLELATPPPKDIASGELNQIVYKLLDKEISAGDAVDYIQGLISAADSKAMMREATHRANDALDRLLRLDRGYTASYLEEYLGQLRIGNKPAEETEKQ